MEPSYFLRIYDEIDENHYIEFKDVDMSIGTNIDVFQFNLFYYKCNNTYSQHRSYSNVSIYGDKEDGSDSIRIATFFKHSNINFGIEELLNNSNYLSKMKLKVMFTHTIGPSLNMKTYIYIEKQFLLSLYLYSELPRFIFKIIEETPELEYYKSYNNINNSYYSSNVLQLNKTYKRELFPHQIHNVNRMNIIENNINKVISLSKLSNSNKFYIYDLPAINERLICDDEKKVLNEDELEIININLNGGVLCDNIGLGKTTSMISLIAENLDDNNTTLLLCPTRLCKQWIEEITKTYDLKYKHILNIRQFKKLKVEDYNNYDLIIIHYNFVTNKNYINLCEEEPDNPVLIHNYNWDRLILDEGHELIKNKHKKSEKLIFEYLQSINATKKWIVSGTPYSNISDFNEIVKFLSNIVNSDNEFHFHLRNFKHNCEILYDSLFIKNNPDDVSITIPKPNIETIFLDMSPLERNIYDSALDDDNKKFELCNHIMVSEQYLSILGNEPQPLNEIHIKMTEYFSKKIDMLTKRIENIDKDIEKNSSLPNKLIELNTKKTDINLELNTYKSKFNIFNNIQDTIDETEDCPICFEELNTLTRTLTPCGHSYCSTCISNMKKNSNSNNSIKCALCRHTFKLNELSVIKNENEEVTENTTTMGTKLTYLLNTVKTILDNTNDKIIIFSQFDTFIKLVGRIFTENNINNIFINGSINTVNSKIKKFKLDNTINVVFISSDKSPSGLNLQEASHIILLDSLNTTKENAISIEDQAIGRAVRIGQTKTINVKRLIMRNTIEHDMYIRNITT